MQFRALEAETGPNDCLRAKHHRNIAKSGFNLHSSDPLQFKEAFEFHAGKWVREGALR